MSRHPTRELDFIVSTEGRPVQTAKDAESAGRGPMRDRIARDIGRQPTWTGMSEGWAVRLQAAAAASAALFGGAKGVGVLIRNDATRPGNLCIGVGRGARP
jgi:hypothetical protein